MSKPATVAAIKRKALGLAHDEKGICIVDTLGGPHRSRTLAQPVLDCPVDVARWLHANGEAEIGLAPRMPRRPIFVFPAKYARLLQACKKGSAIC